MDSDKGKDKGDQGNSSGGEEEEDIDTIIQILKDFLGKK